MIWTMAALAVPDASSMLRDAPQARALREDCHEAYLEEQTCGASAKRVAKASLVVALQRLVEEGEHDEVAIADVWLLDPRLANAWKGFIGDATGEPSAWAVALAGPREPEPQDLRPARFWSVAFDLGTAVHGADPSIKEADRRGLSPGTLRARDRADVDAILSLSGPALRIHGKLVRDRWEWPTDLVVSGAPHTLWVHPARDEEAFEHAGRVFLGAGYAWGQRSGFLVVAGPTAGSTGFGKRTRERLYFGYDQVPHPGSWQLGAEARVRARLASDRFALVFEPSTAWVAHLRRERIATGPFAGESLFPEGWTLHELELGLTLEGQVRMAPWAWWVGGVRSTSLVPLSGERSRLDDVIVHTGVRWR